MPETKDFILSKQIVKSNGSGIEKSVILTGFPLGFWWTSGLIKFQSVFLPAGRLRIYKEGGMILSKNIIITDEIFQSVRIKGIFQKFRNFWF